MEHQRAGKHRTRFVHWYGIAVATLGMVLLTGLTAPEARPYRGSIRWSIILCTFKDSGVPPRDVAFYEDMIAEAGTGGLDEYFDTVSYGSANLEGTVVRGWYTIPYTRAEEDIRGQADRGQPFWDCVQAARDAKVAPYSPPAGQLVAVVTYPGRDMYGWPGIGAYLPWDAELGGIAHEVGHGLGFNHSFSDDPLYRNADWAAIGEYDDPWDVMSYANVYTTSVPRFGNGGPGLNAYHLDRMGWMPRSRIVTIGADGIGTRVLTLAALSHLEVPGYLQVRIPFDPADPFHYYTVEFRRQDHWDAGIPRDIVLMHEVARRDDGQYYSYLLRHHRGDRAPLDALVANGVRISVDRIEGSKQQATVTIASDIVERCLQGYVWREANPSDHVCVTPAIREQTRSDNSLAASRRQPGGGAYGPDTCQAGYVWREAFPGDHVCVLPATRTQAAADNAQAASRCNPARLVYGPNTCKAGYVWREADDSDYVCVPPATRSLTQSDNSLAASRRQPGGGAYGPDTCQAGYVWREAFPGDHVCVLPATRTQAAADNAAAPNRLKQP